MPKDPKYQAGFIALRDLVHEHTYYGVFELLSDMLKQDLAALERDGSPPELLLRVTRWRNGVDTIIDGSKVVPPKIW